MKSKLLREFVVLLAMVMVWRGVWNLLDQFFLPKHSTLSSILSFFIGLGILFALKEFEK